MTRPRKQLHLVPSKIYRRRAGQWLYQRDSIYTVPETVFEFARAWRARPARRAG